MAGMKVLLIISLVASFAMVAMAKGGGKGSGSGSGSGEGKGPKGPCNVDAVDLFTCEEGSDCTDVPPFTIEENVLGQWNPIDITLCTKPATAAEEEDDDDAEEDLKPMRPPIRGFVSTLLSLWCTECITLYKLNRKTNILSFTELYNFWKDTFMHSTSI